MIRSPRRGFTLVELMLSTVMMLIVSGAVHQLLVTTQRLSRTQAEQLSVQATVRGATLAVANELRELGSVEGGSGAQNDILSIAPGAITYRAMRGFGLSCQPAGANQIRISRNGFSGYRDPQAGRDSVYVYGEGAQWGADSGWAPFGLSSVSTISACAGIAGPGITLTLSGPASLAGAPMGTPVRLYELMQLLLYRSEGKSWLGSRSLSSGEAVQPLFGPIAEPDGFRLEYLDGSGLSTSSLTAIKSIRITVRGVSETRSSLGRKPAEAELTTQVALRNALR